MNSSFFFSFFKKLIPFTFILMLMISNIIAIPIKSNITRSLNETIYVDDSNVAGPWDGSQDHPFCVIRDALNIAEPGDTIFIFNGMYGELVEVNVSDITIRGESKQSTILYAGLYTYAIMIINGDYVILENMNIRSTQGPQGNIKLIVNGDHCSIENNMFSDMQPLSAREGVLLQNADYTIFVNNVFTNQTYAQLCPALKVNDSDNVVILGNNFGIYSYSLIVINSSCLDITGNVIPSGLFLIDTNDTEIRYNRLSSYRALYLERSSENLITENNFGKHGLREQRVSGNQVVFIDSENIFDQNYWGRPRLFPKILIGSLPDGIKVFAFDMHPSRSMFNIPE